MLRQHGEGLVLARNGDTYISVVPSCFAAVNSNCVLGNLLAQAIAVCTPKQSKLTTSGPSPG